METLTEQKMERRMYANSVLAPRPYRISWGAVFAGVVMGITVQVLLSALGLGIGASTIDPATETNPMAGVGVGAAAWLFISTIVAYFASGWIAAKMAGLPARADGVLHGLLTWGFSTVVMLILLSSAVTGAVAGTARLFGGVARVAQSAQGTSAAGFIGFGLLLVAGISSALGGRTAIKRDYFV